MRYVPYICEGSNMNFNIYLNDNLVKDLETIIINTKKSRNAIIQEAVRAFINIYHKRQ